jgi:hypothetical protein
VLGDSRRDAPRDSRDLTCWPIFGPDERIKPFRVSELEFCPLRLSLWYGLYRLATGRHLLRPWSDYTRKKYPVFRLAAPGYFRAFMDAMD